MQEPLGMLKISNMIILIVINTLINYIIIIIIIIFITIVVLILLLCVTTDQVCDRFIAREGDRLEEGAAGTPPLVFYQNY